MFAQVDRPQTLSVSDLDHYLENGWFRMGQTIFTTSFLNFKNQFYDAVWLRVGLHEYKSDKKYEKLVKYNEAFKVIVQPASIDSQREELFARYKLSVPFEASPSLTFLLYGKSSHNVYNSYEVSIYDGSKLIAVGIFDRGENTAAGITSFYDPAYKKYSLGKYLIYLKIDYCKKLGLDFFYPGYFVPGYSPFNYKLEIGKSTQEYFNISNQEWLPISNFSSEKTPLRTMLGKLQELETHLKGVHISAKIFRYDFFDANLIPDLQGARLFDYPIFLYGQGITDEAMQPLVVYDIMASRYILLQCIAVWTPDEVSHTTNDLFCSHVLKVQHELMSSENIVDVAKALLLLNKRSIKIS